MPNQQEVIAYLKEVTGVTPEIKNIPPAILRYVPFFLQDFYTLYFMMMMGHKFIVANTTKEIEFTSSQLIRQEEFLRNILKSDVVFAFDVIPPYLRQRLIQNQIPFIVPYTQLFLPFLIMDFRTRTRRNRNLVTSIEKPISSPAQMILLYHLQHPFFESYTITQLSKQFNYSTMTFSRVLMELTTRGLCKVQRKGVQKYLKFPIQGMELWQKALPYLRSPVIATKFALLNKEKQEYFFLAGISALSEYTMLADEQMATMAVYSEDWYYLRKQGAVIEIPYLDESGVQVELWGYNPKFLINTDYPVVDRLSLYLSCQNNPDERVQSALKELMESIQWERFKD